MISKGNSACRKYIAHPTNMWFIILKKKTEQNKTRPPPNAQFQDSVLRDLWRNKWHYFLVRRDYIPPFDWQVLRCGVTWGWQRADSVLWSQLSATIRLRFVRNCFFFQRIPWNYAGELRGNQVVRVDVHLLSLFNLKIFFSSRLFRIMQRAHSLPVITPDVYVCVQSGLLYSKLFFFGESL